MIQEGHRTETRCSGKLTPEAVADLLEKGLPHFNGEVLRNYRKLGRHHFPLEGYHNGKWLAEPIRTLDGVWAQVADAHFPALVRYVDEHLPKSKLIAFSELLPGAVVKPHDGTDFGVVIKVLSRRDDWPYERLDTYFSGVDYNVIRFHLCIISPSSDFNVLGLRCGDKRLTWTEGKCAYFDDSKVHEAWNRTGSARLVLIVDFLKTEFNDLSI